MRSTLASLSFVVLVACTPLHGDPALPPPDAPTTINCDASSFQFAAPQPGLHYSPDLIVIADMAAFYANGLPGVVCVDDLGRGYEPTAAGTSTNLDNGMVEMRWPFSLAPDHRYTLYFSATECERTVEFFTSPG